MRGPCPASLQGSGDDRWRVLSSSHMSLQDQFPLTRSWTGRASGSQIRTWFGPQRRDLGACFKVGASVSRRSAGHVWCS